MERRMIACAGILLVFSASVGFARPQDVQPEDAQRWLSRPSVFHETDPAAVGCKRVGSDWPIPPKSNSDLKAFTAPLKPLPDGHYRRLVICQEATAQRGFPPRLMADNETSREIEVQLGAVKKKNHGLFSISLVPSLEATWNFLPGSYAGDVFYSEQTGPAEKLPFRPVLQAKTYIWEFREVSESGGPSAAPATSGPLTNPSPTEADGVRRAIDEIRSGPHVAMPPAQATAAAQGGGTALNIKNDTPYGLSVYLSGPTSQDVEVPPGGSQSLSCPPGRYEVAARVSNRSVIPFYGVQEYNSNTSYSEDFYIRQTPH